MSYSNSEESFWSRRHLFQLYINGLIVVVVAMLVWKFVFINSPWYDVISNPILASILTALSIILLPFLLGAIVVFALDPLLGKWQSWSEMANFQNRLLGELSSDSNPQIVLFNWPTDSIKSIGVVTGVFPATEKHPEMASVYCPATPRGHDGFIRFVNVTDLHFTGWTLKDLQVFNLTLGSIHPDQLLPEPGE